MTENGADVTARLEQVILMAMVAEFSERIPDRSSDDVRAYILERVTEDEVRTMLSRRMQAFIGPTVETVMHQALETDPALDVDALIKISARDMPALTNADAEQLVAEVVRDIYQALDFGPQ